MKKTCVLAAAFSIGCLDSRPEFREGACETTFGPSGIDDEYRSDFQELFEVGPNPSMRQGDDPKPLEIHSSTGSHEYMNPLFHDEGDPGYLGSIGTEARELYADDWSEFSQAAFDTWVLHIERDAELCLTGHRTQKGIHQSTYDVIYSPGHTMLGPDYSTESFVVQVDEDSGNVWVALRGEPTSID